jgi:NADPH2:quinone reductase
MRAHGGPDVLAVEERADPEPGEHQVVVDVATVGVNFLDVSQRTGRYPVAVPFVPGVEAAGVISEVGRLAGDWAVGDRVAWAMDGTPLTAGGAYAERVAVHADRLVRVPAELRLDQVAAGLMRGLTAHYLITTVRPIGPKDTVLVHAAAGGLGSVLVQAARARGAKVIGTASTPEKREDVRRDWADAAVDYPDAARTVRELTDGAGADLVVDGVGAATFEQSLAAVATRGTIALIGTAGSVLLTRPRLGDFLRDRQELTGRAQEVLSWLRDGVVSVRLGGEFALEHAARAHAELESRRTSGKLLLTTGRPIDGGA